MSERYYRQSGDAGDVDLDDEGLYDYILDRDRASYRNIANTGPKCMRNFSDMREADMMEHFENSNGSKKWIKHILLVIFIAIVLYLFYTMCIENKHNNMPDYDPNLTYHASFTSDF